MTSEFILDAEEGHIDRQRIAADDNLVLDEYFCPICDCLLWKPRSCASCQNLFCHKCIQTWLNTNATSCPFRCASYEERRAPPHIQSMLARLPIRCRNAPFGCTQILSYDSLEQHENVECQFLTKRCRVCEKLVLLDDIQQHQMLCRPSVVQCSLCHCAVEPTLFQSHYEECLRQRMDQLQEQITGLQNLIDGTVAVPQRPIDGNWFAVLVNQMKEESSRPPTVNLTGIHRVFQARQQGRVAQSWALFILILLNLSTAPYIMFILLFSGIGSAIGIFIVIALALQKWFSASIYRGCALIIVLSGLLNFGFDFLLRLVSDTVIIAILSVGLVFLGSMNLFLKLDNLQMPGTLTQTMFNNLIVFVVAKLALLFVRFYFYQVPPYVTAACLAWSTIFLAFHFRHSFIDS